MNHRMGQEWGKERRTDQKPCTCKLQSWSVGLIWLVGWSGKKGNEGGGKGEGGSSNHFLSGCPSFSSLLETLLFSLAYFMVRFVS